MCRHEKTPCTNRTWGALTTIYPLGKINALLNNGITQNIKSTHQLGVYQTKPTNTPHSQDEKGGAPTGPKNPYKNPYPVSMNSVSYCLGWGINFNSLFKEKEWIF